MAQMMIPFLDGVDNGGKKRKGWLHAFSPFPADFSEAFTLRAISPFPTLVSKETQGLFGKGLKSGLYCKGLKCIKNPLPHNLESKLL